MAYRHITIELCDFEIDELEQFASRYQYDDVKEYTAKLIREIMRNKRAEARKTELKDKNG